MYKLKFSFHKYNLDTDKIVTKQGNKREYTYFMFLLLISMRLLLISKRLYKPIQNKPYKVNGASYHVFGKWVAH